MQGDEGAVSPTVVRVNVAGRQTFPHIRTFMLEAIVGEIDPSCTQNNSQPRGFAPNPHCRISDPEYRWKLRSQTPSSLHQQFLKPPSEELLGM